MSNVAPLIKHISTAYRLFAIESTNSSAVYAGIFLLHSMVNFNEITKPQTERKLMFESNWIVTMCDRLYETRMY
ncbi:hypothetical protein Bhyg_13667 [Pseudolycoriella hygida]|uniref:Uncharacterized protein n=1 Tax=Pseudolycoriella hygida TaxID=35572 RepID=A0A9Q0MQF7_9DIPT|nr:hypothetical protein Bhyg_13667 [Pseudolycoriella hygida]